MVLRATTKLQIKAKVYLSSTDSKAIYGASAVYDIFASSIGDDQFLWLVTFNGFKLFDKQTGKVIENQDTENDVINRLNLFGFCPISRRHICIYV